MSWFGLLRRAQPPSSAQTAKDRLQIILAHERQDRSMPDYLPLLQRDLFGVISKYIEVTSDQVQMRLRRAERLSTLKIEIELPMPAQALTINPVAAAPRTAFAR
ncbi:MAG TPA: cell division topological specificity factor MinE [Stellaceae bacterium]|nr:cell division topological specificity factor MinE [Stellaceae bacterium]